MVSLAPMARTTFLLLVRWSWPLLFVVGLAGCGTTHPLPPYETPLARANVQSVRTTAYTHTESDHLEYGNHNALGGTLRGAAAINDTPLSPNSVAVGPPQPIILPGDQMRDLDEGGYHGPIIRPAASVPVAEGSGYHVPGAVAYPIPPGTPLTEVGRTGNLYEDHLPVPTTGVGSAAADWSRWPAGTVFRIAATGQVYKVDDYGWALAGRNTIDLYQPTRTAMNAWGTRRVNIEVLRWGDPTESLRMLRGHQKYRHIHRMVLELEGKPHAAAAVE